MSKKTPTKRERLVQEIAELEKQLQAIEARHAPAMAAHRAENEQASIAHGTLVNARDVREVKYLSAVGYSRVAVYDAILSRLKLDSRLVHIAGSVKGRSLQTEIEFLVNDFEQALRKNASTPEQQATEYCAMKRSNETCRKLHNSTEACEIRYAGYNLQSRQDELKRLPTPHPKEVKTAEELTLADARAAMYYGFDLNLFGITAKLRREP